MNIPVNDILLKMIRESGKHLRDTAHLLKVYAFAKAIGEKELSDASSLALLETAAILHDIACPSLREKFGRADGRLQEAHSSPLVREFLSEFGLPEVFVNRVDEIISNHHTVNIDLGIEHAILLEADFLVNADEGRADSAQIETALNTFYQTETGKSLLKSMYL